MRNLTNALYTEPRKPAPKLVLRPNIKTPAPADPRKVFIVEAPKSHRYALGIRKAA